MKKSFHLKDVNNGECFFIKNAQLVIPMPHVAFATIIVLMDTEMMVHFVLNQDLMEEEQVIHGNSETKHLITAQQ